MKRVTVEEFLDFNPCRGEDRVRAFAGDRREWTAPEVLRADGASAEEKLWAALRETFIDAPLLHEFACRCAEEALRRAGNPDPRSVDAIACKRRWLRGEATDAELDAAREAAQEAAWGNTREAARFAAWDAARGNAREAARFAAWDAAWEAARFAARGNAMAARAEVMEWQVKTLWEILEEADRNGA